MAESPTVEPLTGRDAVEAISLVARLGNQNARFESRGLTQALRTRGGRLRVMAGLALRAVVVPRGNVPARQAREKRPAGRATRPSRVALAPDRPEPRPADPQPENGSCG